MFQKQIFRIVSVFTLLASSVAVAANKASTPSSEQFELTNKTSMAQVRALPDDKIVVMSSGRKVRAKNLKSFADMLKNVKTKGAISRSVEKFSMAQGAAQIQLNKGSNLHVLEARNASDVVQLPSGRRMTVGDFKKLDSVALAMNGKRLTDLQPAPPKGTGTPIKIKSQKDLEALADKPDSTLLESPLGKKITLGELRAYAKKNNKPLGVR